MSQLPYARTSPKPVPSTVGSSKVVTLRITHGPITTTATSATTPRAWNRRFHAQPGASSAVSPPTSTSRITPSERLSAPSASGSATKATRPRLGCLPEPVHRQQRTDDEEAEQRLEPDHRVVRPQRRRDGRQGGGDQTREVSGEATAEQPDQHHRAHTEDRGGDAVLGDACRCRASTGWRGTPCTAAGGARSGASMPWNRRRNGLSNQWPSKKPRACQW